MHIYKLIRALIANRRYKKVLDEVYEQDQIIAKLSTMFGTQFYKDRVGRLYAVINPAVKDGKYDYGQVFEYTQEGYDTSEHMTQWIMQRLIMIEGFIQANNLFDLLSFKVEKLDENGNYLFIIYPITLPDVLDNIKGACWELGGLVALGTGLIWGLV